MKDICRNFMTYEVKCTYLYHIIPIFSLKVPTSLWIEQGMISFANRSWCYHFRMWQVWRRGQPRLGSETVE
jgi:hypothetical protein